MKGRTVLFSRAAILGSDKWQTPEKILDAVRRIGPISLDPCSARGNPTRAQIYWYTNGLGHNWYIFRWSGLTFVNPPYSQVAKWIGKILLESQNGWKLKPLEAVALVPSRTDRPWFQEALNTAQVVCYVKGRLRFKGARFDAPFPSAIFYYGQRVNHAVTCLAKLGFTLRLPTPARNKANARYWQARDRAETRALALKHAKD